MTEVTRSNFEELFPQISSQILDASFVAFDAEFTALNVGQDYRNSLFDTPSDRYQKLKINASRSIISQIGLAIFRFDKSTMGYTAHVYNFYTFPRSFGPLDTTFSCQSGALEFLAQNDFDFNKFIYRGIGYLNKTQELVLKNYLEENAFCSSAERNVSRENEKVIKAICSDLAEWIQGKSPGVEKAVACGNVSEYIIQSEIRTKFGSLWTSQGKSCEIRVKVVSAEEKNELLAAEDDLIPVLLEQQRGFSRLIATLISSKKPVVGHNCLYDLVRIYHQFIDDLPPSYADFKTKVHEEYFPEVFDTKFIAIELQHAFKTQGNIEMSNALSISTPEDLYAALNGQKLELYVPCSPNIVLDDESHRMYGNEMASKYHEAGYDAYITGYCFIRLAHAGAIVNYLSKSTIRHLNFREHRASVFKYANQLQIIWGGSNSLNLAGEDPESKRPPLLLISSFAGTALPPSKLSDRLASFGPVEVRPFSKSQALVAPANMGTSRKIVSEFKSDKTLSVVQYQPLLHGKMIRALLWSSTLAMTACLLIPVILKRFHSR